MLFSELSWPRKMNISLLKFLPEEELTALILNNLDKARTERRIVLPSKKCARKVVCYFYGKQVEELGTMSWDEAMEEMKGDSKTLKALKLSRKKVKQLYEQRKKEISLEISERLAELNE